MNENEEHGAGGGGSGGGEPIGVTQQSLGSGSGGDESIGVAQQALTGCCCPSTVGEGKPVKCYDVANPSQCTYGEYTDGACNPAGGGDCSVSGGHGVIGSVDGIGLFFALAFCAVIRRRRTEGRQREGLHPGRG